MTLSDLRTRVYYRIGRAQDLSSLNTDILYALNTIQREINLSLNLEELRKVGTITLVDGTQSYNLASDFLKMAMIWNNASYDHELQRITPNAYKNFLSDVDTTEGTPYYYDIFDNVASAGTYLKKISLFPIPGASATAQYHYYRRLTDLSADTDENILTELYPDLMIEGAAYILYRDVVYRDNPERIAFRLAQYQRQIEIVKTAQRQTNKISKITPKRYIPTKASKLYTTQYTGYTS